MDGTYNITKEEARYYQDKATLDKNDKDKGIFLKKDLEILNVLPENHKRWRKDKYNTNDELSEQEKEGLKLLLGQTYENILEVLKDYSDLKERDYQIIALWIIGTYFYKEFITFPYLFLNAMKGSGKSRTLRLITSMSWNGQQLGAITEASLFRTAGKSTLGLDEFEGISKKENQGLREILNSGYKKGMTIIRMKKQKTDKGEEHVAEYFEPYTPIVMANIWGMEEVLGDRCITAILDKSTKPEYTLKMEDFDDNILIKSIKNNLNLLKKTNWCRLCSFYGEINIYRKWNNYINHKYNNNNINDTYNINNINDIELDCFFNEIVDTGLNGRDLELYLPLIIIGRTINKDISKKIMEISKETTKEKKQEEMMQSKDIMLIEFITKMDHDYYMIKDLVSQFKIYIDYSESDEYSKWLNPKWFGRALKRLDLKVDDRRLGTGREVTLNIKKAEEKLKIFK